jgi:DmsE family decaheme c-type cytochrome
MSNHTLWKRWFPAAAVFAAAFLCAAGLSAGTLKQKQKKQDDKTAQQSPAPAKTTAQYVGDDTCKTCHDDIGKSFEQNPHWKTTLNKQAGPAHQGCEGCHGPGSEHVSSGGQTPIGFVFSKLSAEKVNSRCLECHATGATAQEQLNFEHSVHAENNVSCLDCHSVHHGSDTRYLLVKQEPELCYGCHRDKQAQFNMPWHHKVNEGLVRCSDCHNPHGSFIKTQLRTAAAQDAVCFTCHEDKQGPFVFEHEPVKTEGCMDCHIPHGSPNPHLLRYANVNQLCLQCHTVSSFSGAPGIPSFHNQSSQFNMCVLCHTQIHGSNFDPYFFK